MCKGLLNLNPLNNDFNNVIVEKKRTGKHRGRKDIITRIGSCKGLASSVEVFKRLN